MNTRKIFLFALIILLCLKTGWAQKSELESIPVFTFDKEGATGKGNGYRIPSLITTNNGTVLAFAERRVGLHDHAQNDIVVRRSEDNGKSWSEIQVIADHGKKSLNDPLAVVLETGRILLMFQGFPYGVHARNSGWIQMADNGYDGPRNTKTYITFSDDDGKSWAELREITKSIRPTDRIPVGSPGIGIQIKNGEFKGRIVMPFYFTRKLNENDRDWTSGIAWSDDQGETWQISNDIPHRGHTGFGNEAQVVEKSDGSLLFVSRNQGGFHRKVATSTDGGRTWSNFRLDFELPGTACQGSVLRYSFPEYGESMIIQSGPANKYERNKGTVKISTDEGETWKYSREITPAYFAYSCLTKLPNGNVGLLYETNRYREIRFVEFSTDWIKEGDAEEKQEPYLSIPTIDLNEKDEMHVVVDKEKGQYLGHPTTVLLEDNKTILTTYPKGHGRGAIVYKKSTDGGLTWGERLPTPESWSTSKEVPTLFPMVDKYGKKRLIMFSGLYPARMAVSEDNGETWSELEQIGDWGGIVVMGCMIPLKTGKGHYMSFFHDDIRFFTKDGIERSKKDRANYNSKMMTLYKSVTTDGGLTWSFPEEIYKSREIHVCEPGVIRSPDGNQIAVLLRENSRRDNSQIIFSDDEGKTWSNPKPLPNELTGDRHVLKYAPDGRLFISFRDRSPGKYHEKLIEIAKEKGETNYSIVAAETGFGSPTEGDWVGWVGTYDDLVNRGKGQYRIRLKDNTKGWDTTYPGVELLPDGTFVVTTYGHWEKGEESYILSTRFKLEELDKMLNK
ncbi:MAG: exo-alpha-sialidase [Bacteroidetes bacterium]|nr:exo-alpha-sialidase [Bacteroidota bacterium]